MRTLAQMKDSLIIEVITDRIPQQPGGTGHSGGKTLVFTGVDLRVSP